MMMNLLVSVLILFLLVNSSTKSTVCCIRTVSESDTCNLRNQRDQLSLRWDQITVLINGYSEHRIPLLQSIAATYSSSPLVSSVQVLWGNPSTTPETLSQLSQNLSLSSIAAPISLLRQKTTSLNARFIPRSTIQTHAVLICDDDIEIDRKSLEFAFRVWQSNTDRLQKYTCEGGDKMAEARRIVDEMHNCEDILMNFVVAEETRAGPVMVGAERVRDWGDARNEMEGDDGWSRISSVGLSSRRSEHRKRRGKCLMEFHRVMGMMQLRYSYGKIVDSVGEQGLCNKGGKLVFCDQY